jgi:trigger factor
MLLEIQKGTKNLVAKVTFEGDEWKKLLSKEKNKYLDSVKLPGFRKGKVPQDRKNKFLNMPQIYDATVNKLLNENWTKIHEDPKINDEDVVDSPVLSIEKIDDDRAVISLSYDFIPEISISKYKSMFDTMLPQMREVTQKDVDSEVEKLFSNKIVVQAKENKTIAKGDIANFDFEGYINNEKFQGGSAKNYELKIGSGQFIPGFEEQMIGMKTGDSKDLEVTFPENYGEPSFAGKLAVFKIKLNDVKTSTLPAIDDEMVKEIKIPNVNTVQELRTTIERFLNDGAKKSYETETNEKISKKLVENSKAEIPQSMIKNEIKRIKDGFDKELKDKKMNLKSYLKSQQTSEQQFEENIKSMANNNCMLTLALQKIINDEKIEVTGKEIEDEMSKMAQAYNMKLEDVKSQIKDTTFLEVQMLNNKVMEFLRKNN